MKKWLFNPFFYVAGTRSLVIGWVIMLATAFISYYSHAHFDGVIDIHIGRPAPMPVYFYEQLIDWACAVLLFYIAGLAFSKSRIRFIDVAGTFALARWPMIICAVAGFAIKGNVMQSPHTVDEALKQSDALMSILLSAIFLVIPFTIWMIALMYNAFKVSCNIREGKGIAVFISALLIAELAAHIILYELYKHLI